MCDKHCCQKEDMGWPDKIIKAQEEYEKIKRLFPAFRWSTSGDERVCPECRKRDGKIYFFKDNPIFPGIDKDCRCIAESVDEYELEEMV